MSALPLVTAVTVKPPQGHAFKHWRHGPTSAHTLSCRTLPGLLEHVEGWGGVGASHCSTQRSGGQSERGEVRMAEPTPQGCPAPRRLRLQKQMGGSRLAVGWSSASSHQGRHCVWRGWLLLSVMMKTGHHNELKHCNRMIFLLSITSKLGFELLINSAKELTLLPKQHYLSMLV